MKQALFIINPTSARGRTLSEWTRLKSELIRAGLHFDEHVTTRPFEAIAVARQALVGGCDRLVAVGGDGTLNELVNGYLDDTGNPLRPGAVIGLLPSGTGQDFLRSIAPASAASTSSHLLVDAARVRFTLQDGTEASRIAINAASAGLGGRAAELVNRWRDRLPSWVDGSTRFLLAALRALLDYENVPVRIVIDGTRSLEADSSLIVAANGRYAGGGMMLAPDAAMDDGLLDVVFTDGASRLEVLGQLGRVRRGRHLDHPKVGHCRAASMSVEASEPMPVEVDGDPVGFTPMTVTVLPSRVRVAVFRMCDLLPASTSERV